MHTFEFTTEELETLQNLLRHRIGEINLEVFRTDSHDFKDMLKRRQRILQQVLDKLMVTTVDGALP